MTVHLTIYFVNGSEERKEFPYAYAARSYAKDNISYSGGRVKRVELCDEYGCNTPLWSNDWDALSKNAGLNNGLI